MSMKFIANNTQSGIIRWSKDLEALQNKLSVIALLLMKMLMYWIAMVLILKLVLKKIMWHQLFLRNVSPFRVTTGWGRMVRTLSVSASNQYKSLLCRLYLIYKTNVCLDVWQTRVLIWCLSEQLASPDAFSPKHISMQCQHLTVMFWPMLQPL